MSTFFVNPCRSLLVLALLGCSLRLAAQSAAIPLQSPSYHLLDRLDISSGVASPIHPELKFFLRKDAAAYAVAVDSMGKDISRRDRADLQYLCDDNTEWFQGALRQKVRRLDAAGVPQESWTLAPRQTNRPPFGIFYRTPANFYEVDVKHFNLRVNPMFNFAFGKEQNDSETLFANERGIDIRGSIDEKVFFQTNIIETQSRFPDYVTERVEQTRAIPGAGFFKNYSSTFWNVRQGYDYNIANAFLTINASKHIGVQFGHGKNFIGNGYRSLFLSDFGNFAFFLKLNTRIWKLHYQNIFMQLTTSSTSLPGVGNQLLPRKYVAMHYLSYRPRPNLSFGIFEATVLNRSRQFELQYLNPVILYRTVEGMIGSPDNVLIGLDGRWNFLRRFQVYGQLLLDEFLLNNLFGAEQKGWWANKYGIQLGAKYVNAFGVDHLDLQLEYNSVRPYTYSHFDSLNSFTHYLQPLAHPLNANFREFLGIARYQPHPKLMIMGRYMRAKTGEDTPTESWGGNPLLSYNRRVQDFGNVTGQGVTADISLLGLEANWQIWHNLFFDVRFLLRRKDSADDQRDRTTRMIGCGLRMNLWNQQLDF